MKKGETVVFMGAGNISRFAYKYVNSLSDYNVWINLFKKK